METVKLKIAHMVSRAPSSIFLAISTSPSRLKSETSPISRSFRRNPFFGKTALTARDFKAAVGVFALVVLATVPVVVPFVFMRDVYAAMRVSNGLAVATLYGFGHVLGKYSGGRPWRYGLAIAAVGMGLVVIIMALGG